MYNNDYTTVKFDIIYKTSLINNRMESLYICTGINSGATFYYI